MIGQNKPLEIDYNDYSSEESFYFIARILTSLTTLMLLEMWGIPVFVFPCIILPVGYIQD